MCWAPESKDLGVHHTGDTALSGPHALMRKEAAGPEDLEAAMSKLWALKLLQIQSPVPPSRRPLVLGNAVGAQAGQ